MKLEDELSLVASNIRTEYYAVPDLISLLKRSAKLIGALQTSKTEMVRCRQQLLSRIQKQDFQFDMRFTNENSDGSANYELRLDEATRAKLVEVGVISLLKERISSEQKI